MIFNDFLGGDIIRRQFLYLKFYGGIILRGHYLRYLIYYHLYKFCENNKNNKSEEN